MPATGKPRGRPPADLDFIRAALALAAKSTPEDAAEALQAQGHKVSSRTIREWQHGRNMGKAGLDAAPKPSAAPTPPEAPPTAADRKIDELIARSRTWRRVCEAFAEFAREHPAVAPALAAKLRSLDL